MRSSQCVLLVLVAFLAVSAGADLCWSSVMAIETCMLMVGTMPSKMMMATKQSKN